MLYNQTVPLNLHTNGIIGDRQQEEARDRLIVFRVVAHFRVLSI